ncbi:hypothetical protein BpHYR1_045200 [Brachionus plicatilis]|uniref:Uncharacterized protein n=1 Tax=Brachionus plicatilis TaxID=10195 RepID=A0A3M7R6Y0_BRAPC|nr:hypothetical protein BpHYR1_045200 [Brachionus plicatilis]
MTDRWSDKNEIARLLSVSPKCVSSTKKRFQRLVLCLIEAVLVVLGKIRKSRTSSYQKLATDLILNESNEE